MAQRYKHGDRQLDNTTCFMVTSVAVCVCERACVCVCVCMAGAKESVGEEGVLKKAR